MESSRTPPCRATERRERKCSLCLPHNNICVRVCERARRWKTHAHTFVSEKWLNWCERGGRERAGRERVSEWEYTHIKSERASEWCVFMYKHHHHQQQHRRRHPIWVWEREGTEQDANGVYTFILQPPQTFILNSLALARSSSSASCSCFHAK